MSCLITVGDVDGDEANVPIIVYQLIGDRGGDEKGTNTYCLSTTGVEMETCLTICGDGDGDGGEPVQTTELSNS